MKKVIFLIVVLIASVSMNAQTKTLYSGTQSLDTVVNTATERFVSTTNVNAKFYSLQITVTKISGTVGGTLKPCYSNDGTNWFTYASDSAITATDASGSYGWQLSNVSAPYVGVQWAGTGTMSASASATISLRR